MPGVADITNFGGITTQFQLELDPQQLMRFNLSLKNVTDAINANSANAGGSVLTRGELGYVVRGIGVVQTLHDMGNIVVTQRNGTPIFVRDLGRLKLGNQERHGILGKDDKNDVIEGIVLLLRGENPSAVMEGVHAKVAELNERLKAEDVQIVPFLDRSDLVDADGRQGVAYRFPGHRPGAHRPHPVPRQPAQRADRRHHHSVRDGGGLHPDEPHEHPANLLSLGAIDFGIIVDGAIVMTEAILRRREAKPDEPLTEADAARRCPPGRAADLLRDADHHHRLPAAVRVPAHRGEAVLPDGLCGRLCAVRRAAVRADGVPGLAYLAYRRPRRVFHNRCPRMARSRLSADAAALA